jgi:S1-C subfamily serine protease
MLGLVIGSMLAGAGVIRLVPSILGHAPDPTAARSAMPIPAPERSGPSGPWLQPSTTLMPKVSGPPVASLMPTVIYPGGRQAGGSADPHVVPVPLPNAAGPPPAAGSVVAGTGFFIADDGSLLTASHVVQGCQHIRIVSKAIALTDVTRVAQDRSVDVALLRGGRIRPPAVLALATARPVSQRLFILGFPGTANFRVPDETWGTLENTRLGSLTGLLADTRQTIWVQSGAVTHGYSGGPILDTHSGTVAGLVKAGIDLKLVHQIRGLPSTGLSMGPGAAQLTAFVRRAAPQLDLATASDIDDDAMETARRATVHVLCWQ